VFQRRFALLLTLVVPVSCALPSFADGLQLKVRIQNLSTVSPQAVDKAERIAERIFAHADLKLSWNNCDRDNAPSCKKALEGSEVSVQLTTKSLKAEMSVSPQTFGASYVSDGAPAQYSYVFCDRLQSAVGGHPEVDLATGLGYILAHELGHLLLGSNAHTHTGIMQSRWSGEQLKQAERGALAFDETQSLHIRAEVRKRVASMVANSRMYEVAPR